MDEETLKEWVEEANWKWVGDPTLAKDDPCLKSHGASNDEAIARHVARKVLGEADSEACSVDGHQVGCAKERRDPLGRNHRGEYECDCVVGWITDRLRALDSDPGEGK